MRIHQNQLFPHLQVTSTHLQHSVLHTIICCPAIISGIVCILSAHAHLPVVTPPGQAEPFHHWHLTCGIPSSKKHGWHPLCSYLDARLGHPQRHFYDFMSFKHKLALGIFRSAVNGFMEFLYSCC